MGAAAACNQMMRNIYQHAATVRAPGFSPTGVPFQYQSPMLPPISSQSTCPMPPAGGRYMHSSPVTGPIYNPSGPFGLPMNPMIGPPGSMLGPAHHSQIHGDIGHPSSDDWYSKSLSAFKMSHSANGSPPAHHHLQHSALMPY